MSKPLTTEEFERMLDAQQGTARLTLSSKRYSADSIEEQFEMAKTSSDTQQLADFLRNTGPAQESGKKKKGGLFGAFGKKKKRDPSINSPLISQPKYIPLTALPYSNNNVSSPSHHHMYPPQPPSPLTREHQILTRETVDGELDREKSNGFVHPPITDKPYPLLQHQPDDDEDEDEGLDSLVLMNTEYNSTVLDVPIVSPEKKKEKGTKVAFAEMVEEIGHPDDLLPIIDDLETMNVTVGISERGSYYPTFDEKQQPLFNQRQSSLSVKDVLDKQPPSDHPPKTRSKKKIRHVQIQTRASITKPVSTQTSPTTIEMQLRTENAQILADSAEKAMKFDKLSSAAYKKIKELLNERKMLEIEVGSLKDQLDSLHDFQARQWNGEVGGNNEE